MALSDKLLFTGKLLAKTTLFVGEVGVTLFSEGVKDAIRKGASVSEKYDQGAVDGLAEKISNLNKKIKL